MSGSTAVLCVTDDDRLLGDVRAVLQNRAAAWDVRSAADGGQAADLLARGSFDALVTGAGAALADGTSLLEYVHDRYPAVARLVLSGDSGPVRIEGGASLPEVLSKPCTPGTLPGALELVLQLRELVGSPSLREHLGGLDALAKPPRIYSQLVGLSQDPASTAEDVVELVQQDVGLAAEVLRLVNSAFYGRSSQVNSIHWAVVLLGLDTLKALAIAGVVFRPGHPLPDGLDSAELAADAVRASVTAQKIARRERWDVDTVSDVALSALLADVGLLALVSAHPQKWVRLRELATRMPVAQAQREAFGCTVGHASAYLLGLWGFPPGAVAATAAQPLDVADPVLLGTASPAALAVAFAHRKARGQAEESAFARSDYLDDDRLTRWQSL